MARTMRGACTGPVPGPYRHDFRRTAVRNPVNAGRRAGRDDDTGNKTRSVSDRDHIVSPGDLQEAARRLRAWVWA